jgi:hypothetical protein
MEQAFMLVRRPIVPTFLSKAWIARASARSMWNSCGRFLAIELAVKSEKLTLSARELEVCRWRTLLVKTETENN